MSRLQQLFPVPCFTHAQIEEAKVCLQRNSLCTAEQTARLLKRVPQAQGKTTVEYLAVTDASERVLSPAEAYTRMVRVYDKNENLHAAPLYALLLDGFVYELNIPMHLGNFSMCETPLTYAVYFLPILCNLLLDLPEEYGLDVNLCIRATDLQCAYCRGSARGMMRVALNWLIERVRIHGFAPEHRSLFFRLLSRSSTSVLNSSTDCPMFNLIDCIESHHRRGKGTSMFPYAQLIDIFLKYVYDDGSGISLTLKHQFDEHNVDTLEFATWKLTEMTTLTRLHAAATRVRLYRTQIPHLLNSVFSVYSQGFVMPLISIVIAYVLVSSG